MYGPPRERALLSLAVARGFMTQAHADEVYDEVVSSWSGGIAFNAIDVVSMEDGSEALVARLKELEREL